MVNTRQKYHEYVLGSETLSYTFQLDDLYQQYLQISVSDVQLPKRMIPPAGWNSPLPAWNNWSRYMWMAVDMWQINYLYIDNILGASPVKDNPNQEPIHSHQPDVTCTPDPIKTKAHRKEVGVENTQGIGHSKATELYNKDWIYTEQ